MKFIHMIILLFSPFFLTACHSTSIENDDQFIGMSNPASQYCINRGGSSIPKKDKKGNEFSLCKLPNGKIIEEWKLYKQNNSPA